MTDLTSSTNADQHPHPRLGVDADDVRFARTERPDTMEHRTLFAGTSILVWIEQILEQTSMALLQTYPPPEDVQPTPKDPPTPTAVGLQKNTRPTIADEHADDNAAPTGKRSVASVPSIVVPYQRPTTDWCKRHGDVTCYVCLENVTAEQPTIVVDCMCRKPIHDHCLSDLVHYTILTRDVDGSSSALPRFATNCGHCQTSIFGTSHSHFTTANDLWANPTGRLDEDIVPTIIVHLSRVVRNIWTRWRGNNFPRNKVLADMYQLLGASYLGLSQFSTIKDVRSTATTLAVSFFVLMWEAQGLKPYFHLVHVKYTIDVLQAALQQENWLFVTQVLPVVVHVLLRMLKGSAPSMEKHCRVEHLLLDAMGLNINDQKEPKSPHVSGLDRFDPKRLLFTQLYNFVVQWRMEHMMSPEKANIVEGGGGWNIKQDGTQTDSSSLSNLDVPYWGEVSMLEEHGKRHRPNVFISSAFGHALRHSIWVPKGPASLHAKYETQLQEKKWLY